MALVVRPSPHDPHHLDLYIVDTYRGLMVVGWMGGVTILTTGPSLVEEKRLHVHFTKIMEKAENIL
ncbi:hypothetical protein QJS10_CPA03g01939 [Acorus calamus]|uniref:Uncharacterized protein n=1 Tax=Acorus calamus TaxID=4465 RepID=A0AAV9F4R2_ACOCL|nr:hypothetical protein QJS10_CPA03g01939 [Acorus calamus]